MGEARKRAVNALHRKLLTTEARIRERQADDSFLVPEKLCLQVLPKPQQPHQLGLMFDKVAR
jgi:hypothetical protein